jgi:hypothetical protein
MDQNKPKVLVLDLPHTLTASEMQDALNVEGYYITRMMSLPEEAGLRVIFTKRAKPE